MLLNLWSLRHKINKLCFHPHLCRKTVELIGVCLCWCIIEVQHVINAFQAIITKEMFSYMLAD